jgi:flagellin-like protein
MKRIWSIKKKAGVSPVIATILMVAITVVLAAVLYVMVMNMSTGQSSTTPQGGFATAQRISGTNVTLTFSSFSKQTSMAQLKIVVEATTSGTQVAVATWALSSTGAPATLSTTATISAAAYYDVANNNQVNIGDTCVLTFASAGSGTTPYKVSMIYVPTGDTVNYITFSN